jgi:hypothetical protein
MQELSIFQLQINQERGGKQIHEAQEDLLKLILLSMLNK